jgi:hypothetical protein
LATERRFSDVILRDGGDTLTQTIHGSFMISVICGFLRSLGIDSPQWKGASRFETGIDAIDQVKTPIVTRADKRFFFAEGQGVERTSEFTKQDLDDNQIFVALLIDGENFG